MRIFHYQLLSREILFFQRSLFRYGNKRWCPVCGWKFSFGQDDHVRLYGMDFMQRRESEGFKVESTDMWNRLDEKDRERCRISENELFYYVKKDNH